MHQCTKTALTGDGAVGHGVPEQAAVVDHAGARARLAQVQHHAAGGAALVRDERRRGGEVQRRHAEGAEQELGHPGALPLVPALGGRLG